MLGFEFFRPAGDFTPMFAAEELGGSDVAPRPGHAAQTSTRVVSGDNIFIRATWVPDTPARSARLPGTEVIEFSPADEYDQTLAVVAKEPGGSGWRRVARGALSQTGRPSPAGLPRDSGPEDQLGRADMAPDRWARS